MDFKQTNTYEVSFRSGSFKIADRIHAWSAVNAYDLMLAKIKASFPDLRVTHITVKPIYDDQSPENQLDMS